MNQKSNFHDTAVLPLGYGYAVWNIFDAHVPSSNDFGLHRALYATDTRGESEKESQQQLHFLE